MTQRHEQVRALAVDLLTDYITDNGPRQGSGQDAGPAILAANLFSVAPEAEDLCLRGLKHWLNNVPDIFAGVGAFGGLGGLLSGLRTARALCPAVAPAYSALCSRTNEWLGQQRWRRAGVSWPDYDLFFGPAGAVRAGLSVDCPPGMADPAIGHLVAMAATDRLVAFCGGPEIDQRSAFNIGRINTGLGHGLAGVASALSHAVRVAGHDYARPALRQICRWLVEQTYLDDAGLLTWPPVGPLPGETVGTHRRQAWCYGTPGVSWTLWEAADTLADEAMRELAEDAMASFVTVFDEARYLDPADDKCEDLALCHGAAGTLAVADAFALHTSVAGAPALRDRMLDYLIERAARIRQCGRNDISLLTGAAGMAAVALTATGADRQWLHHIAVR
jgi:class I lanthipeptide synthase